VRVVEEPIEERGDGGGVTEELALVVDGAVRREERAYAFVATHDEFEEVFGRGRREFPHPDLVDFMWSST
jgi:hypothetical protein